MLASALTLVLAGLAPAPASKETKPDVASKEKVSDAAPREEDPTKPPPPEAAASKQPRPDDCPECPKPKCPEPTGKDAKAKTIEKSARTNCNKKGTREEQKACRKARMTHWRSYPHRGFIAEVDAGFGGCVGQICGDNLDTGVGGGVTGLIGGNLFGFAELGVSVGWSGMAIRSGGNPIVDHGIDPTGFANAAAGVGDDPVAIAAELEALDVGKGQARLFFVAGEARVHFLPAGRGELYLGSGVAYSRWRALYDVDGGEVDLRMPGIGVPVVLGGGFYVKRFLIVNLQLRYMFTSPRQLRVTTPTFDGDANRDSLKEWDAVTIGKAGAAPQFIGLFAGVKFRV